LLNPTKLSPINVMILFGVTYMFVLLLFVLFLYYAFLKSLDYSRCWG